MSISQKLRDISSKLSGYLEGAFEVKVYHHRVIPEIWIEIHKPKSFLWIFTLKDTVASIVPSWREDNLFVVSFFKPISEEEKESISKSLSQLKYKFEY